MSRYYTEYLDKEMTIMGLLSAFCVAAPGLVLQAVAGAREDSPLLSLWKAGPLYWIVGSVALLLAALFFYRERSLLAWYYGQLCLAATPNAPPVDEVSLLRDADSWETWILYRCGFCSLTVAFALYVVALFRGVWPNTNNTAVNWTFWGPITAGAVAAMVQWWILRRYALSDEPWRDALRRAPENSTRRPRS